MIMVFIVYAIHNQHSDKIYIGQTANLEKRLQRHNKQLPIKATSYTAKAGGIWRVIYTESFVDRNEAMIREKELKSYRGREFVRSLINKIIFLR